MEMDDGGGGGIDLDERVHNEVNEITSRTYNDNARAITYDDAGNIASYVKGDGSATWTFTYDYRNRVVTASDGAALTFSLLSPSSLPGIPARPSCRRAGCACV